MLNGIAGSPTGVQGPIADIDLSQNIELSQTVVDLSSEMQHMMFGMFNQNASVTVGGLSISISGEATIRCPVHGSIAGAETLHLKFPEGIDEKYCLRCLRDQLRKTVAPLGEAMILPSDSSSITTLSRYEILKRENNEKIT